MTRSTIALLFLCATSAFGQTTAERPVRKGTVVDFTAVPIEGTLAKPANSYVPVRQRSVFANLITIRGDFTPELQKSADRL